MLGFKGHFGKGTIANLSTNITSEAKKPKTSSGKFADYEGMNEGVKE